MDACIGHGVGAEVLLRCRGAHTGGFPKAQRSERGAGFSDVGRGRARRATSETVTSDAEGMGGGSGTRDARAPRERDSSESKPARPSRELPTALPPVPRTAPPPEGTGAANADAAPPRPSGAMGHRPGRE